MVSIFDSSFTSTLIGKDENDQLIVGKEQQEENQLKKDDENIIEKTNEKIEADHVDPKQKQEEQVQGDYQNIASSLSSLLPLLPTPLSGNEQKDHHTNKKSMKKRKKMKLTTIAVVNQTDK